MRSKTAASPIEMVVAGAGALRDVTIVLAGLVPATHADKAPNLRPHAISGVHPGRLGMIRTPES